jgi:hypothetical protein
MNAAVDRLFLWLVDSAWFLPVNFLVCLLAVEMGYRIARRRPASEAFESRAIASSIVMLLALLMTLTIREQSTTYRATLRFMGDETDAIAETWRRVELLEPPERTRLLELLDLYMQEETSPTPDRTRIASLQKKLWQEMRSVREHSGDQPGSSQLLVSLNKMIALHWRTESSARQRVPAPLALMDMLGILLVSVLVGYSTGTKASRAWTVKLIFLGMIMVTLHAAKTMGQLRTGAKSASRANLVELYQYMKKEP